MRGVFYAQRRVWLTVFGLGVISALLGLTMVLPKFEARADALMMEVYTSDQTVRVPRGAYNVPVLVYGGGGAGGSARANYSGSATSGAGGNGGLAVKTYSGGGFDLTITVGSGGISNAGATVCLAGTAHIHSGGDGGTTTVVNSNGDILQGDGGTGGDCRYHNQGTADIGTGAPGIPGGASGGDINTTGGGSAGGASVYAPATSSVYGNAGTAGKVVISYDLPPPTITGVSPDSGLTTGGGTVAVYGTNFISQTTAEFDGQAATCQLVSDSELSCLTPPHAVGPVDVTVATAGDSDTLAGGFNYVLPSVTPNHGPVVGGNNVTIMGGGFAASADYQSVEFLTFDGTQYINSGVDPTGDIRVFADFKYNAFGTDPDYESVLFGGRNSGSDGLFFGVTNGGMANAGYLFYYGGSFTYNLFGAALFPDTARHTVDIHNNQVVIDNLNKATFTAGTTATSTQPMYIGMGDSSGTADRVFRGNVYAMQMWKSGVMLRDFTPAKCVAAGGCADSGASNGEYGLYDKVNDVFYRASTGTLSGGANTAVNSIMASKNNTATFDGTVCESVSYIDATHISCLVPPHATVGWVDVVVGGAATITDGYAYEPFVSSTSPVIRSGGGDTLTIMGAGFASGVTSVTVGGADCGSVNVISATQLTCISPPSSLGGDGGGEAEVIVTVGGFVDSTPHKTAVYRASIMITSVSPDSGTVAGGNTLTINGNNFLTSGILDYQAVEYLTFDGTQYINSGVNPTGNIGVWADYQFNSFDTGDENVLFGGRNGGGDGLFFGTSGSATYLFYYGGAYTFDLFTGSVPVDTARREVLVENNVVKLGSVTRTFTAGTTATSTQPMYIGMGNSGGAANREFSGRVYGLKIWKEGVLVRDFIPVRCANASGCGNTNTGVNATNGEYGLYDRVNGVFYRTGAGTLSGGGSFATTVMIGDVPCAVASPATDITNTSIVCSLPVLSPEHAVGPVDVVVNNGFDSATRVDGYSFIDLYLNLGLTSPSDPIDGNVSFSVLPNSSTGNSDYTIATVETNSPSGYKVSLESNDSDLICKDNATYVIPSITSDGALTIAGGQHGAWGWNVVLP
ncbi:MAG: IPT/TIG domain-containing protein, partial [Candidatus Nomurabacteria bacterium]|nr:IPT/TIG domain-containing protein [Candidatus Nomurabacteria bacterium]